MMRNKLSLAFLILLCGPSAAHAQFGAQAALRYVNGEDANASITGRRGYELRASWDGRKAAAIGWRAELGVVQMSYHQADGGGGLDVSENSLEFAALGRAESTFGALTGLYALAGPVASARLVCGVSGGYVDCADNSARQLGYTFGAGYRWPVSARRAMTFEVRFADRLVGAAKNSVVSLGVGIRGQ